MSPEIENIPTWPGWEIIKLLGVGFYGKVYEIRRIDDNNIFRAALKVIQVPKNAEEIRTLKEKGMDDKNIHSYFEHELIRFKSEYKLLAKLRGCPNIVIYDDHMIIANPDKLGWTILIKMELLKPFRDYLEENSISDTLVSKSGIELCKALEACHAHNIFHRNINLGNMFINEYGNIKLGGFSIAVRQEDLSKSNERIGTFPYIAPEVYQGKPIDCTADIYSVGMVMYRMLNGIINPLNETNILPGPNTETKDQNIFDEPLPYPENGSRQLKKIIMRALQFDPTQRFQSAIEMRLALESITDSAEAINEDATFDERTTSEKSYTFCPFCDSSIPKGIFFCPVCGKKIIKTTQTPTASFKVANNDTLFPTCEMGSAPYKSNFSHKPKESQFIDSHKELNTQTPQFSSEVRMRISYVPFAICSMIAICLLLATIPLLGQYSSSASSASSFIPKRTTALILFLAVGTVVTISALRKKSFSKSTFNDTQVHDVFISFKHSEPGSDFETQDCKMAEELYNSLTTAGLDVFFSKISLPEKGRSNFKVELEKALYNSSVLIVVATSIANLNSEWVAWETKTFYNILTSNKKNLIAKEMYCYLTSNVNKKNLPDIFTNRICFQNQADAVTHITNRLNKPLPMRTKEELHANDINRVWSELHRGIVLSNGRYNLIKAVKQRKYYILFSAFDNKLDKNCFIKIINRYTVSTNFIDPEIALLRELNSCISGIPFVYDFDDSSPDVSYSVMTSVPGTSLEEKHNTGQTFVEKDIILWTIRLSEIIEQLHNSSEAIVHCNVKPSNVYVGPNSKISLINYSCAYRMRVKTELNKYRAVSQTYVAPELLNNDEPIDGRADIFSIGYIMLYMLTEKNLILEGSIIRPEEHGISPELSSVICKCMAFLPDSRYPDCSSLIDDLRKIQQGTYIIPEDAPKMVDLSFEISHESDVDTEMTIVFSDEIQ